MISRQSIIVASREQVSCDLAGEAAILNLADGVYYGLDPVGACIWNMLGTPTPFEAICRGVMVEFDVDAGQCERDVAALLEQLERKGLIEVSNGNGA